MESDENEVLCEFDDNYVKKESGFDNWWKKLDRTSIDEDSETVE